MNFFLFSRHHLSYLWPLSWHVHSLVSDLFFFLLVSRHRVLERIHYPRTMCVWRPKLDRKWILSSRYVFCFWFSSLVIFAVRSGFVFALVAISDRFFFAFLFLFLFFGCRLCFYFYVCVSCLHVMTLPCQHNIAAPPFIRYPISLGPLTWTMRWKRTCHLSAGTLTSP